MSTIIKRFFQKQSIRAFTLFGTLLLGQFVPHNIFAQNCGPYKDNYDKSQALNTEALKIGTAKPTTQEEWKKINDRIPELHAEAKALIATLKKNLESSAGQYDNCLKAGISDLEKIPRKTAFFQNKYPSFNESTAGAAH